MLTLSAAVLAAAAVAGANAAPSGWPMTGEKVRVTTRAGRSPEKGVVVQTDAESLTVSLGSGRSPVQIPIASIERLEVARGRRTTARDGALVGGFAGAVLGGLAVGGLMHALCENGSDCSGETAQGALVGAGLFGTAGAGAGALIGLAIKTDRWERLPVNRVRVGILPAPAGASAQISLAWGGR
jgi:hypothetical protein